jgi:uncharacterized surface protein with fasciclin (FAS1) repeats
MKLYRSLLLSTLLLCACGDDDDDDVRPPDQRSILERAQAEPSLTTLVAAVEFASDDGDLVDLLDASGSLTLFAPTNQAFDELAVMLTGRPGAVGADLLVPANRMLVRDVLQYHVLAMRVRASEIPFGEAIEPVGGGVFLIEQGTPPVITDGRNRRAQIISADLGARNGVIHVIDRVLLPADKSLVETAQDLPEFTILAEALAAAELIGVLDEPGPFTVFAPTDAAFHALLQELKISKANLLADRGLLVEVLTYHVVPGRVFAAEVPLDQPITTVQGGTFRIDSGLTILDARGRTANIIETDVIAENGVIHVIDRVLLPQP